MGVVGLSRCISGLSALIAVMASAISYGPPGPGPLAKALPAIFGGLALAGAGIAIGLGRLPPTCQIRQSTCLWFTLTTVVLAEIVMVALVG